MKKGVTMREIGAALGVSTVTISKALSGKDGVSDAVREKIIRTAQQMGYHYMPPAGAAEEPSRPDTIVGILTPERFFGSASFYASLYKELLRQMVEAGMLGVLEIVTPGQEQEMAAPLIVTDKRVSALVLMGQFEQSYVEMIVEAGLPTVLLDFYCDGPDVDAIVSDSLSGCYQLTRHLIDRGHRDIGFVGSVQCTTSIMERYSGYLRAMVFEGLSLRPEWLIADRDAQLMYLPSLSLPQALPTAFVCENDEIAMQLIAQLARRGVRVPEDVSVTGFDNFTHAALTAPMLTTYSVDQGRMAQVAIQRLQCRIKEGPSGPLRTIVGGWIVERSSTRDLHGNKR